MQLIILSDAEKELQDTVDYYNDQLPGLGDQFYYEVLKAFDLILRFPSGWAKTGENIRKFILKRFPYLVLYVVHEQEIVVNAIAHQHRHPDFYTKRRDIR
jgi:toxin ParE1/3/4